MQEMTAKKLSKKKYEQRRHRPAAARKVRENVVKEGYWSPWPGRVREGSSPMHLVRSRLMSVTLGVCWKTAMSPGTQQPRGRFAETSSRGVLVTLARKGA